MDYINVANSEYSFPSRDVSEEVKNSESYNLEFAKAIIGRYVGDRCAVKYSDRTDYDIARAYGRGEQPIEIYKTYLEGEDRNSLPDGLIGGADVASSPKSRKGWENIIWDVVSPMPRIKTVVKGYLDQFGQDVFVDTIDPISGATQEGLKWRMYAEAQNMEFLSQYKMKIGIPQEEMEFFPANITELNLFEAMGGFKLNYARAMEKLIRHTEEISSFEEDLKDRWADDAMDLGVIAGKVELDKETGKFIYRYVDPKHLIMQYVGKGQYDRSEYAGEVRIMTVSELKQLLPGKEEKFFTDMAKAYSGRLGNKKVNDWDNYSMRNKYGTYNYDNWTVEVADVEWIDYEAKRHLIYDSVHGRRSLIKIGKDTEVKALDEKLVAKGAKQKEHNTKMRKIRCAKWIIGTNCVFDYGLVSLQDRPKMSAVMHSYRLYVLKDPPLISQLMPVADDMALSWFKYQNGRNMAVSAGYTIDVGMMENLDQGKMNFTDVIKKWRQTGVLLHQQSLTGDYHGGAVSPISPIPSIMTEILNEWIASWDSALKRIEDLTGLNLIVLGSTANQNAAVGTTQMSANSAVYVLRPIIDIIGRMKITLAESTMRRLQLALKSRKDIVKNYESVVGESDLRLLISAERDAVQYGMNFEDRPSTEAKGAIIEGAQISLNARRDGKPGITLSQYLYILEQIEAGGNLKELRAMIDFLTVKSEKVLTEQNERNIQLQGEQNAQAVQMKAQADAEAQQMKIQAEMAILQAQAMVDLKAQYVGLFPQFFQQEAMMMSGQMPQGQNQQMGMPNDQLSPQSEPQAPPEGDNGLNQPPMM